MAETNKPGLLGGYTDADFRRTILRAIRLLAIVVAVLLPLIWWKGHWQSAALWVIGAAISGSGLYEWLRLMTAVMERMDVPNLQNEGDTPQKVRPLVPVMMGFFLRMGIAVVVLYVSLKTLDGSVYALAAGMGLGVFALTVEALRMMRLWTV